MPGKNKLYWILAILGIVLIFRKRIQSGAEELVDIANRTYNRILQYIGSIRMNCVTYQVPVYVVLGVIYNESRGDPTAYNQAENAIGLMQIRPAAAEQVGMDHNSLAGDPFLQIAAGVKYLRWCYDHFNERSWFVALQEYNAGVGSVQRNPEISKDYAERALKYGEKLYQLSEGIS